jgi:signal peptidase II
VNVDDSAEPTLEQAPGRPWWRRLAPRLVVVALLVALDLWSKSAVFAWLLPRPEGMVRDLCGDGHLRYPIFGEWFTFMLSWNPGMAWGIEIPPLLLVSGRVGAVLFLACVLARVPAARRVLVASLVLILAGALGNLYDNLFTEPRDPTKTFAEVRDFIDVYFPWGWHFPTFNVADSCITVGAVLLFGSSFFEQEEDDSGSQGLSPAA